MAKAGNICGNKDGTNRENQSYTIKGRGIVSRPRLVKEVKIGIHEGVGIYTREGISYVRALQDGKKINNIDPDE